MRAGVDILASCAARGLRLEVLDGDVLRAAQGSLSPETAQAVRQMRSEVAEALRAGREPASVSAGELHWVAIRAWRHLPVPSTVYAETLEGRHRFAWTCSRAAYARLREERVSVFVGGELEAVTGAAQLGRARPERFREWVQRKAEQPEWRSVGAALEGLAVQPVLGTMTFGQLAWEIDVRLLEAVAETGSE